jgi:polysaccharide lyase-like protein
MKFTRQEMIFNGAFAFMFAGLLVYMVRDSLVSEVVEPCSQRYLSPTVFTLDNGSGPLSNVQLVGNIGASQRGIYNNAKVVKVRGVPGERALKVLLRPSDGDANGIRFRWSPRNLEGATSACLTYSVYLPKKFESGGGGFLPGIYTGKRSQPGQDSDVDGSMMQRVIWLKDGNGALVSHSKEEGEIKGRYVGLQRFELPRGRWVPVEQEIVLNNDGKINGLARVFVDGEMVLEKKRSKWRKSNRFMINGVRADIGYKHPQNAAVPPVKVNSIYVSQMKLRWQ